MTRFSDEMLSAYLDGELSADERTAIEAHLAASEPDRRLLEELQALRGELLALPQISLGEAFADRVVWAAVAAKSASRGGVTTAAPGAFRSNRWLYWAAATLVSLAACVVLVIQPWKRPDGDTALQPSVPGTGVVDPVLTAAEQERQRLIQGLRQNLPGQGEAVVVRLRVPKGTPLGQSLDVAFAEAGIGHRSAADVSTNAIQIGAVYRKQLGEKFGGTEPGVPNPDLNAATVAASEAVFVEATLGQIEEALAALAASDERSLDLAMESKLAVSHLKSADAPGEGEAAPHGIEVASQPFAQRLNAGMYRLEKREIASGDCSAAATLPAANPKQAVRVLILVEQVE